MKALKKKRSYSCPAMVETQSDLEGLLCTSAFKTLQVDQLHNINADSAPAEELYFEF